MSEDADHALSAKEEHESQTLSQKRIQNPFFHVASEKGFVPKSSLRLKAKAATV